jgi:aldose 1-epimerase
MLQPQFVELKLDSETAVTATISTAGAALKRLTVGGTDLITLTTGHELNPYADGLLMAPWANRIDGGKWKLDGQELQLEINDPIMNNAIHGLVSQTVFEIANKTESSVTLSTLIQPTAGYPFKLEISVTFELTSDGIDVKHHAKNLSENAAPFVVGAHPYLQISGTPTEELEIKSSVRTVDLVNERKIPIGKQDISGSEFDITDWRELSTCDFDHGFSNLVRDSNGRAHHLLRSPSGEMLDIWQSAEMKYAFIFTPDFYTNNADQTPRTAIAIEPQTGPANAFNSKEDLIWIEPNQAFDASWGLVFTPASQR